MEGTYLLTDPDLLAGLRAVGERKKGADENAALMDSYFKARVAD